VVSLSSVAALVVVVPVTRALFFGGGARTPRRVVVSGPGATEVNLIAAKMAAKLGNCEAFSVVRDPRRATELMYGRGVTEGPARAISGVDAIADALATAEALILTCDFQSGPPTEASLRAVFGNAPKLRHVALLSTLGGQALPLVAKPFGPFEGKLRELAAANRVQVSVVRVGNLKGGGPGEVFQGKALTDFGLDKFFYDTLIDLSEATATMAYDRFALGATVRRGDPLRRMPNPVVSLFTAGTFEPLDTDCSRLSAAAALVAAVRGVQVFHERRRRHHLPPLGRVGEAVSPRPQPAAAVLPSPSS